MSQKKKKIGLVASTALVVGNMVGSGVFMLPAALAVYGDLSLWGWGLAAFGALVLAFVFSALGKHLSVGSGGPYRYTKSTLGEFAGFFVAWGYWISVWCTNAAIAIAFVGYLSVFLPELEANRFFASCVGLSAIWIFTWINSRGVKTTGAVQIVTVILKIFPLVLVAIGGLFFINVDYLFGAAIHSDGSSDIQMIIAAGTLVFFAFQGMESATIPAEKTKKPKRNVPIATMVGILIAIVVYISSYVSVAGVISPEVLSKSSAPFADAGAIIYGDAARYWIALGAIISTLGALNGWILIQGEIPASIAGDNLFPKLFSKENKREVPIVGIAISSVLASVLMLMNYAQGLAETFKFIILLSTFSVLLPYLMANVSLVWISIRLKLKWKWGFIILAIIGFLFSMLAIYGCGKEAFYYGILLLLAGFPIYIWMKRNKKGDNSKPNNST